MKKQTELEKKFNRYMSNRWRIVSYQSKIIAHDLTEIAEKENTELKKQLAITKEKIIEVLEKYLDRGEVEEAIDVVVDAVFNHKLIDDARRRAVTQLCQLKPQNQVVIAEGEINGAKWESPYNKLVFYFKGLPKMIGIKTIKGKNIKIILEENNGRN